MKVVNDLDLKIRNFYQLINNRKNELISKSKLQFKETIDLKHLIESFVETNLNGIADDFDLNAGCSKLIELINFINKNSSLLTLYDFIKIELIVNDYLNSLGLIYHGDSLSKNRNPNDQNIIRKFVEYRKEVRKAILDEKLDGNKSSNIDLIIKLTDNLRNSLAGNHLIVKDEKYIKNKE